jgi:glycosyltransferase involved in cell wall biosynthesis
MACGVVPIATRVGGIPEVIDSGTTGFLANVGDVDAMADFAINIWGDEAKLAKMARQARAVAQSQFCTTKIIPQYEEFYRRVLERS